jgi:transcriptional regulator with XRE-family HTH domain
MEAEEIILKNIRIFRKLKDVKSEMMARELGISQSEYSKLENGLKRKWTEYLPKIAQVLGVTFQELVSITPTSNNNSNTFSNKVSEPSSVYHHDIELYERLIFEMKEKDKLKDELLNTMLLSKENYKKQFEIMMAKLRFDKNNFNDGENLGL